MCLDLEFALGQNVLKFEKKPCTPLKHRGVRSTRGRKGIESSKIRIDQKLAPFAIQSCFSGDK